MLYYTEELKKGVENKDNIQKNKYIKSFMT
jgi:hypothetical protein